MIYIKDDDILLKYAINDKLVEEKNGRFDLEFDYPMVDENYKKFKKFMLLSVKTPKLGYQDFYIVDIQKTNKGVKIFARHVFFLTSKIFVKKISYTKKTCQDVFNSLSGFITDKNDFSFYSDITDIHSINMSNHSLYDVLTNSDFSILKLWKGTYVRDNYSIKLLNRRGTDTEYIVAKRKNISDLQIKESSDYVVTRLYLSAKKRVNDGSGKEKEEILETCIDSPLINIYPYIFSQFREYTDSFRSVEALEKYGKALFSDFHIDLPKETFTLKCTNEINSYNLDINDTVLIYYEDYNINKRIEVTSYTYSPMTGKYLDITFGYRSKSLADTLTIDTNKKIEKERKRIDNLADETRLGLSNVTFQVEKKLSDKEKEITENLQAKIGSIINNLKKYTDEEIKKINLNIDDEKIKALSNLEREKFLRSKEGQKELIKAISADVAWLKTVVLDTQMINSIVAKIDIASIKKLIVDSAFIKEIISKDEFKEQFEDGGVDVNNIFNKLKNNISLAIQTRFKDQMGQIKEELNSLLDIKTNEIVSSVSSKIDDKTDGIKSELLSVINQNKNEINLSVEKIQKGEDVVTWSDDLVVDSNRPIKLEKDAQFTNFELKYGLLNNETYRAVFDVNSAYDISKSKLILGFKKNNFFNAPPEVINEYLNLKDISLGHNDFNFTFNDDAIYNHFFDVSKDDGNNIKFTFTDEFYSGFENQEVTFAFKTTRGVKYYDFDHGLDHTVDNSNNEIVVFKTIVKDKNFNLWIKDTENNWLDTKHTAFKNFKESFKAGTNSLWFYDSFKKEKYFEDVEKTFYRDKEIEVTEEEERQEEETQKLPLNNIIDSVDVIHEDHFEHFDTNCIQIMSTIVDDINKIPIIRIKLDESVLKSLIFKKDDRITFKFIADFDEDAKKDFENIYSFFSDFNDFKDFGSQDNLLYKNVDNFKKICISATKEPIDGRIPICFEKNEIELSDLRCETSNGNLKFAKYICFLPAFREQEGRFFINDFMISNFQVELVSKVTRTKKVPVKKKKIIKEPYTKMVKEERERIVPLKLDISNCHLYRKNIQKSVFVKKDEHEKDVNRIDKDISNIKIKSDEIVSTVSRLENDTEEKLTKISQKADNISLSVNSVSTSVNEINKEINLIKEEDRKRKSGSDLYFYTTEKLLADKEYKLIFNLESAESPSSVRIYNCKSSYDYHIKKGTNNLVVAFSSERENINIDSGGDKVITDIRLFKNDGIDTQRLVSKENVISAINLDKSGVKIKGSKVEISGNVDISGDVIIHKINNTSSYTTISGDKIESGTIRGATLDARTKLKIGSYGFMQPVSNGLQIDAPESYGANYGVGIQLCGRYESLNDGKYVPKGLFIYEDSDFNRSNTASRSNTTLVTVGGRVQCLSNRDGNGKQIEGFAVVSENLWNDYDNGNYNIFNVWYNNDGSQSFCFGGAGFEKQVDAREYSDIKLKHGINDTKIKALDVLKDLSFKEFYWNENNSFEPIGLIAQDVEKLDKNLVGSFENSETKEESRFIKNYALNIYTAKAIQELENEVSKLKEEVKRLRGLYEKH
ncbi:hypothetical protein HMPREF3188_00086 [Tissierellia bacterium KA00581]|nr:hypothetical protein HMPREF3188_00086 [Tissierellia bacterium KA00581]